MTLDSSGNENPKYPIAVFFIVANEFCERFSYYGIRTILSIYLSQKLDYGEDTATTLYHSFSMLVYFFPLLGAIVSDSWLGKFKTITYLSLVYTLGNITLAGSALPYWTLVLSRTIALIGLLFIALGTGGIKPCVSAFGGDQFILPQQDKQLVTFFSIFYFAINSGSFISTLLTPILREDVHCLGEKDCYPMAFGVPGVLMIVSIVIFVGGRSLYTVNPPSGNIVVRFVQCITHAISRKRKIGGRDPKVHWLDYADDEHDHEFIEAVKRTLRIFVLYIPLPLFWALYDQQGSRWTFQATHMKGEMGPITLKPDQFQVVNPLLILMLVPLFDRVIYPFLGKFGILKKALTRITVGLLLAGCSFVICGLLELLLEKTYVTLPLKDFGELRVYNGYMCELTVTSKLDDQTSSFTVSELDFYVHKGLEAGKVFEYSAKAPCAKSVVTGSFEITSQSQSSYFFRDSTMEPEKSEMAFFWDSTDKHKSGNPKFRVLLNSPTKQNIKLNKGDTGKKPKFQVNSYNISGVEDILPDTYDVYVDDAYVMDVKVLLGGVYTLMLHPKGDKQYNHKLLEVTEPNSVPILWLLPQYFVMTTAEVMFSVTGVEFSYTQAPASMKSVMQALWLLTVAVGNLIVVIIGEIKLSDSQAVEFFVFAGLMFLAMVAFLFLAARYKYAEVPSDEHSLNLRSSTKEEEEYPPRGIDNVIFKKE